MFSIVKFRDEDHIHTCAVVRTTKHQDTVKGDNELLLVQGLCSCKDHIAGHCVG